MVLIGVQASDDLHERWRMALAKDKTNGAEKLRELIGNYLKKHEPPTLYEPGVEDRAPASPFVAKQGATP